MKLTISFYDFRRIANSASWIPHEDDKTSPDKEDRQRYREDIARANKLEKFRQKLVDAGMKDWHKLEINNTNIFYKE